MNDLLDLERRTRGRSVVTAQRQIDTERLVRAAEAVRIAKEALAKLKPEDIPANAAIMNDLEYIDRLEREDEDQRIRFWRRAQAGKWACKGCGQTISLNKLLCLACAVKSEKGWRFLRLFYSYLIDLGKDEQGVERGTAETPQQSIGSCWLEPQSTLDVDAPMPFDQARGWNVYVALEDPTKAPVKLNQDVLPLGRPFAIRWDDVFPAVDVTSEDAAQ